MIRNKLNLTLYASREHNPYPLITQDAHQVPDDMLFCRYSEASSKINAGGHTMRKLIDYLDDMIVNLRLSHCPTCDTKLPGPGRPLYYKNHNPICPIRRGLEWCDPDDG